MLSTRKASRPRPVLTISLVVLGGLGLLGAPTVVAGAKTAPGTMTIAATTATAGATGQSFVLTYKAPKNTAVSGFVNVVVPTVGAPATGFSPSPSGASVSVQIGSCTSVTSGVFSPVGGAFPGTQISINASCLAGGSFTITYFGVTTPATAGAYTFYSAIGSTPLSTFPVVTVQPGVTTAMLVQGPATTQTAGSPFVLSVTAKDANGNTTPGYRGTVHFSSSDTNATLPANYTFKSADSGTHTFNNKTVLTTAGPQTVSATDTAAPGITGISAAINVGAAATSKLVFTAPSVATVGTPFGVTVTAEDVFSNVSPAYSGTVHFTASDTGSGVAVPANYTFVPATDHGVHTFTNGVTLVTTGAQTVTATDTVTITITGTSAAITVSAPAAGWAATGGMATARVAATATLLANGKVLVAGGNINYGNPTATAELYNPATGTWTATGSMATARVAAAAALLPDGKVLVAGGDGANFCNTALASAELYDPTSGTWSAAADMISPREFQTATLLTNGKVLMAGGNTPCASPYTLNTAELYDETTNTWTATTSSMVSARYGHTATLLNTGKVLVTGGQDLTGFSQSSAELYDPTADTWTATGSMTTVREFHAATLLANGKVLVTGGQGAPLTTASANLYDPNTGTWSATGDMISPRQGHTSTLLANGEVLVAGGDDNNGSTESFWSSAELYDPAVGTWSDAGNMAVARLGATATLLPNGKVLVAGGQDGLGTSYSSADLYTAA